MAAVIRSRMRFDCAQFLRRRHSPSSTLSEMAATRRSTSRSVRRSRTCRRRRVILDHVRFESDIDPSTRATCSDIDSCRISICGRAVRWERSVDAVRRMAIVVLTAVGSLLT